MFSISLIEGKYRFLTGSFIQNEAMTNSMNGVEHPTGNRTTNAEMELPLVAATDHLNCDLALFSSMMARGIVRRCDAGQPGQPPMFAREDLDRLLARIESVATPVPKREYEDYGLPYVAAKVGVAEVEIVQLILEGTLGRVARLVDRHGIRALRVRPGEVQAQLEMRAYPGMPWIEAAEHLGVKPAALPLLVEPGELEVEKAEVTVSGYRVVMVSRKSLADFKSTFIEWGDVTEYLRGPFPLIRCHDEIRKATPAIISDKYRLKFFKVSELNAIISRTHM